MLRLHYLGRALSIQPGEACSDLEELCTVYRQSEEMDYVTDSITGDKRQVRRRVEAAIPLFWYDKDKAGNKIFAALSGFGARILDHFKKKGVQVEVADLVEDGLPQPELAYVKGTHFRTGQKEVFVKMLSYKRGIIVCPTGFGKTFLIKLLAKVYPTAEIIITVNSTDIVRDIYDDLKYDLGSQLGIVGGGKDRPARVTICTAQSLHKCPKSANLILADECHTLMTENYVKKFNKFRRARMFGLTATPVGRSDKAEGFGEALFGSIIADISYQQGVSGGNIVPINVRMYRSTVGPEVSKDSNRVAADRKSLWLNRSRNTLIAEVVTQTIAEIGPEQQLLIMVDKTEHAYALGQLLPQFAVVSGEPPVTRIMSMRRSGALVADQIICSNSLRQEYKEQFENHTLKYAIATKVWSKGVNFRDLAVLCRADGLSSAIDSGQIPGRLSRLGNRLAKESGLLIDFIDLFSKNLQRRSQNRISVYRSNGYTVEVREL